MSNLNRQFLFRKEDIGKSKSLTACNAIKKMNPDFNCISSEERVEPKTENIFNEKFWKSKDFVICGLDNVKARNYVNKTCHKYNKTFFSKLGLFFEKFPSWIFTINVLNLLLEICRETFRYRTNDPQSISDNFSINYNSLFIWRNNNYFRNNNSS